MNTWLIVLTSASVGALVSSLTTFYIGRKQIELSRRIASKEIIAPMRQAWINTLREKLAELTSRALHYFVAGFEERSDKEYLQLGMLEQQITLLINPKEQDHQELVAAIREMVGALDSGDWRTDKFPVAHTEITKLGQKILKTEWDRIKSDIDKP